MGIIAGLVLVGQERQARAALDIITYTLGIQHIIGVYSITN
jgi:hypothetical protein